VKGSVNRSPDARRDLIEVYRRYEREAGTRTAERFLTVAEAAFLRLAAMPAMGARLDLDRPLIADLRYLPLPSRFKKHIVFYRPVPGGIEVARVLHGSQDISAILSQGFEAEDDT